MSGKDGQDSHIRKQHALSYREHLLFPRLNTATMASLGGDHDLRAAAAVIPLWGDAAARIDRG